MAVCNKDRFACPYPDCINDDFDLEDRAESKRIDALTKNRTERQKRIAAYKRAYCEANKDKIAARSRAYYEANKDKIAARSRAYYEANKDEVAAYQRAYYEANKDKIAAYKRAYCEANKDKIAARNRSYRAKPRDNMAAAAVVRYRKEHGLTQAAFGRLVGLSQGSVSLLESGQQTIPERVLALVGAEIQQNQKGGANYG